MVNFRYHLISLVAVFLAIALGIGFGVTVVDKATVDNLQNNLNNVRNEVNAANQRSDGLQRQLSRAEAYDSQSAEYLIDGKLRDVPVVVVGVRGIDTGPLSETRNLVKTAGATLRGTLWLTGRNSFDDKNVATQVQRELGLTSSDPNQLRQATLARVGAVLAGGSPTESLRPLLNAGVLDWEGESGNSDITRVDLSGLRVILASGARPDVSNDLIARPLAKLLAAQPTHRTVAIESGREPDGRNSGERAVFTGPLRSDSATHDKLSTVDDIEVRSGRVAVVLALAQLPSRTGDYGVGSGADSAIPKLRP